MVFKSNTMEEPVIRISQGLLKGTTGENMNGDQFFKFHGIPFAKPPVGELRFQDPQQPGQSEHWEGIRDASKETPGCYQLSIDHILGGSEDCLHLSVYTKNLPENNNLKPVMVWFYGGSYKRGSNSTHVWGPEFLLNEYIVLVIPNYRVGVLGFLSLQDPLLKVSGNAALKDQNMALQWVQKNIKNFGGDPNNVTIFGESAGSSSAHYHILSPRSKGLFHKAILQSGCALSVWGQGSYFYKNLIETLGKNAESEKEGLQMLRALPVEELHQLQTKMLWLELASKKRAIGPVIEKESESAFIWKDPRQIILSGEYNHVPIIFGYCSKEGLCFEALFPKELIPNLSYDHFVPWMMNLDPDCLKYKEIVGKIEKFYHSGDARADIHSVGSDSIFVLWILASVRYHVRSSSTSPVYLYKMTIECGLNSQKTMENITYPGVSHFDDVGYLFKTYATPDIQEGSPEDKYYKRCVKLWTNFAKYGNPTPKLEEFEVQWTPVQDSEHLETLVIGDTLKMGSNIEKQMIEFWKNIFKENKFLNDYL